MRQRRPDVSYFTLALDQMGVSDPGFVGGMLRELMPDFSATVQYIQRNFRDAMAFIDTGSTYVPVQRVDPGPDGKTPGATITVFNKTNPGHEFLLFTNPPNAFRDYKAFQLIGHKRFSHNWQASLSYTWADTHGTWNNIGGTTSGSGGGTQGLGQTGGFADPNHTINIDGPSTFDHTHQVKLEGTYRVPAFGGFNLSSVYRYITGAAYGRTAVFRSLPATETVERSAAMRSTTSTFESRRRSRSAARREPAAYIWTSST